MAETEVRIPDIGDTDDVSVIELLVAVGDTVTVDQSLITLESDKASMEVPSTVAGTVTALRVGIGDSVAEGAVVAVIDAVASDGSASDGSASDGSADAAAMASAAIPAAASSVPAAPQPATEPPRAVPNPATPPKAPTPVVSNDSVDAAYASPSVRALARELGVDLGRVSGTGRKSRITRDDVAGFVKRALETGATGSPAGGSALPPMPEIDFSKFGDIEVIKLSRIRQRSATNLHRAWLHVPHVTQFEDADITDTEAFRKAHNERVKRTGVGGKLTPVAYVLKAVAAALKAFPQVNASLGPDGTELVLKKYIHLGVAVDTDDGLIVPVIRDADTKGLEALGTELRDLATRARDRKLLPADLKGASFTVSSLGGIGGTAFTPIVNAPEVAILGVSKASMKPVWQDGAFVPRLMLPLSLSYDHRVVDGVMAARFIVHLADLLGDLRGVLV